MNKLYDAVATAGGLIALVPVTGKLISDIISRLKIQYDMEEMNI